MSTNRITRRGAHNTPSAPVNDQFSRIMRDAFGADASEMVGWYPAAEVVEKPEEFSVSLELPGMKASDVNVDFNDGMLTIRGEKSSESEKKDEERKYHVWERSYGSFLRSFEFPNTVDPESVRAEFGDGVLKVHVPKRAAGAPSGRRIPVAEQKK